MRWNEGNDCVLFVFRKECQKAAKNVGVTANPISIWAGPALVFTGPQVGDDPHTPTFPWLPLGAGGLASLLAQEILQSQAGRRCTPLHRDKGQVPVGFNVSLHRAPSSCCLGWHWCIWHPPYFFFAAGLEPHGASSKSSKKGFCPCRGGGRRCEMQRQLPGARKEVWNWSWAKWVRWGWCGVCNGVREGRAARQKQCGGFT